MWRIRYFCEHPIIRLSSGGFSFAPYPKRLHAMVQRQPAMMIYSRNKARSLAGVMGNDMHPDGGQRRSLVSRDHPALRDTPVPPESVDANPESGAASQLTEITRRLGIRPKPNTIWVWIIALSPSLQIALHLTLLGFGIQTTWLAIVGVAAIGLVVNLFLAESDQSELRRRGFDDPASKFWALLPPVVYLAIRGNRIFKQASGGLGPFWLHLSQGVIWPSLALVVTLWGGAAMQLSQ